VSPQIQNRISVRSGNHLIRLHGLRGGGFGKSAEQFWQKDGKAPGTVLAGVPVHYSFAQMDLGNSLWPAASPSWKTNRSSGNYADVLRKHGYEVAAYGTRPEALQAFRTQLPSLALIDVGLADEMDGGFTLCRELRSLSPMLPIIFLSARDSDFDIVSGLRLGADDYLTKDVSLPHLLARIAALFRRSDLASSPVAQEEVLERGALTLDLRRFTVSWRGSPVDLTLTEFWMVHSLAKFPGHVKDRDQLMRDAKVVVDDSTITSHMKRIRKKFLAVDANFDAIDTVYGMGYRWSANA
jgi:two-component system OmpR family response regulator